MDPLEFNFNGYSFSSKNVSEKYYFQREKKFWEIAHHSLNSDDLTDPLMLNFNGSIKVYFNGPDETTYWGWLLCCLRGIFMSNIYSFRIIKLYGAKKHDVLQMKY